MVKSIDNAFDHMESCLAWTSSQVILKGKIGYYFPEITWTKEFPGGKFLLTTISVGSKQDLQVANS